MDSIEITETPKTIAKTLVKKRAELGDLNDDCLIKIFKDFDVDDLLNALNYDNRVRDAARYIFKKKFADKVLTVTNEFDPSCEENSRSMKLLKYFGGVITKLRVEYKDKYRQIDHKLDNLIITNCCESLIEIEFINADLFTMDDINESFQKVRKVTFIESKCGYLFSNFGKWFPKAETLYLEQQRYQDYAYRLFIEQHYPALKHFKIINTQIAKSSGQQNERKISTCNIIHFVKLNPQLKSLWIVFDKYESVHDFDGIKWNYELLAAIQSSLTKLKTLRLEPNLNGQKNFLPTFNFANLKNLAISSPPSDEFPILGKKIESLNLLGDITDSNGLRKVFSNIKVLKISGVYSTRIADFVTMMINYVPNLQLLNELHFRYINRPQSAASMVSLLNAFERLNLLVIDAINVQSNIKLNVCESLRAISANINGWEAELQDYWDDERNIHLIVKKRI